VTTVRILLAWVVRYKNQAMVRAPVGF